jgi:hypothetical protein
LDELNLRRLLISVQDDAEDERPKLCDVGKAKVGFPISEHAIERLNSNTSIIRRCMLRSQGGDQPLRLAQNHTNMCLLRWSHLEMWQQWVHMFFP